MVSGFQDISSDDDVEDTIQNTQTSKLEANETAQKPNTSFDVDIELTSDESADEEPAVTVSVVVDSDKDSPQKEKEAEPAKPSVRIAICYTEPIRDDLYWTSGRIIMIDKDRFSC